MYDDPHDYVYLKDEEGNYDYPTRPEAVDWDLKYLYHCLPDEDEYDSSYSDLEEDEYDYDFDDDGNCDLASYRPKRFYGFGNDDEYLDDWFEDDEEYYEFDYEEY